MHFGAGSYYAIRTRLTARAQRVVCAADHKNRNSVIIIIIVRSEIRLSTAPGYLIKNAAAHTCGDTTESKIINSSAPNSRHDTDTLKPRKPVDFLYEHGTATKFRTFQAIGVRLPHTRTHEKSHIAKFPLFIERILTQRLCVVNGRQRRRKEALPRDRAVPMVRRLCEFI